MFTCIFLIGAVCLEISLGVEVLFHCISLWRIDPMPKELFFGYCDRPVSSADGLYGDMPSNVLISSGSLEFISTHPPQQHSHFPGKLSSPNGSHMPLVKWSS